jgi:hypothetical protein
MGLPTGNGNQRYQAARFVRAQRYWPMRCGNRENGSSSDGAKERSMSVAGTTLTTSALQQFRQLSGVQQMAANVSGSTALDPRTKSLRSSPLMRALGSSVR